MAITAISLLTSKYPLLLPKTQQKPSRTKKEKKRKEKRKKERKKERKKRERKKKEVSHRSKFAHSVRHIFDLKPRVEEEPRWRS
jgi:uncharacterized protein YlxW (UPF0749 family)